MLDIKTLRAREQDVRRALENRGATVNIDPILALDKKRRAVLTDVEGLKNKRNVVSKEISQIKDAAARQQKINAMREVGDRISAIDEKVKVVDENLRYLMLSIPNLRVYDYQPDQVNPPFAFPTLEEVQYHGAMGAGLVTHQFTVQVVMSRASERTAQDSLDQYTSYSGTKSVRAALEADRTLGGIIQDLIVTSARNILGFDANDTSYLSIDFQVTVYA